MLVTFACAVLCCAYLLSCIWLFATPWTVAHQAPLPMGVLQARILEWVAMSSFRGSSWPRDRTQVSHIAGGFFTIWATREPQEYWSGYPIPSPGNFLTQESNWGLLHCKWILYQLSYQGNPIRYSTRHLNYFLNSSNNAWVKIIIIPIL